MHTISNQYPNFVMNSVAPIRICDNGGWTDTWFAGHGEVFNIGGTEAVDVMEYVWTGSWPENRSPQIRSMTLDGREALQNVMTLLESESIEYGKRRKALVYELREAGFSVEF